MISHDANCVNEEQSVLETAEQCHAEYEVRGVTRARRHRFLRTCGRDLLHLHPLRRTRRTYARVMPYLSGPSTKVLGKVPRVCLCRLGTEVRKAPNSCLHPKYHTPRNPPSRRGWQDEVRNKLSPQGGLIGDNSPFVDWTHLGEKAGASCLCYRFLAGK